MKISELLKPEGVILGLESQDKWSALQRMTQHLSQNGLLDADRAPQVLHLLEERERSMSTGMEHGIAVPHTSVEGLDQEIVGIGLSQHGIPFESMMQEPVQILVCLITPRSRKLLHIRTLAEVARLLSHEAVRIGLLGAVTPEAVLEVIRKGETMGLDGL